MHYVNKEATWKEANAGCVPEGEMLAVFPTLVSVTKSYCVPKKLSHSAPPAPEKVVREKCQQKKI